MSSTHSPEDFKPCDTCENELVCSDSAYCPNRDPRLPEGLPELPPVPDGFDRWEYRGEAWWSEEIVGHFVTASTDDDEWLVGDVLSTCKPSGYRGLHYLEAVRASDVAPEPDAYPLGFIKDTTKPLPPSEFRRYGEGKPRIEQLPDTEGTAPKTGSKQPCVVSLNDLEKSLHDHLDAAQQVGEMSWNDDVAYIKGLISNVISDFREKAPAEPSLETPEITDDFRGDNEHLRSSIKALIELNDSNSLVPHGIGGHARALLAAAYHRLNKEALASKEGLS